ncbi:VOC family protein [Microbulbifer taiwanensis]|uniref:VOC family protein n=1 Tax=Microbulbifer taiwanensis TaxID=986746 RepID=A0ABW1YKG5_9GAMM|nr:VOC family protein [Microbulbifer taiwanensis]
MKIQLDHAFVPSKNIRQSAILLAKVLDVPHEESGGFVAVHINEGLTLEFVKAREPFSPLHLCFRVTQEEFDKTLARIRAEGIKYGSEPGRLDMKVNTSYDGSIVYWSEPDGHQWEMLTISYARPSVQ